MEQYKINDSFVYTYLKNKLDSILQNYAISLKSKHDFVLNKLQYYVPEHPADSINITIKESKIEVLLPLLRSPFSYTTNFYVTNKEPTKIYEVLKFLETHLKYYEECYL